MASCFVLSWSRTNRWATSSELRAAEHQEDRVKEDMMSPLLPVCVWIINTNSCNVILSSTPAESVTSLQSLKALRIHVLLSTSVGNYDLHIYTQWFLFCWHIVGCGPSDLWAPVDRCSLLLHRLFISALLWELHLFTLWWFYCLSSNFTAGWNCKLQVRLDLLVLLIGFPQRHL